VKKCETITIIVVMEIIRITTTNNDGNNDKKQFEKHGESMKNTQTVGGFKKCFGEQGQAHEKALRTPNIMSELQAHPGSFQNNKK